MLFKSDLEIRKQLARYLTNGISIADFEDWFVARSWNYHQAASVRLLELVAELELLLAEWSNGHWSEQELNERLRPFVTQYSIDYGTSSKVVTRTSSGSTVLVSPLSPDPPSDIELSVEYA